MNYSVILVVASVAIASATGTLLHCSEQSFDGLGGVLPSSSSGSKFSICSGGLVHETACPSGQAFDVSSRTCAISHNSNERFIVKTSRQFEDLCTNPNEVQILPNPTNCSQYIICFGLVPIEQSCGNGLLFNPELEVCDIPTNVVCGYSCPNVDDPYNPVWLPDARLEDCSRHYLCFQGNPIQFFCSNNLYFDVVSNTCTYPQYSGCSVPGLWCNTNGTEVVENPRSCTSYYECLEGFPHFRNCPDGEYFSSQMGRCVVGACPPLTGTTTTIEPTSTVDWNTATSSITPTVDWNTSMSTLIISTTSSGFPSTEQTTTELPSTPTLSTPEITSPETTTDNPNTSSTPSSTITTTGMETTNIATTIETSSSTTDELSTTVVPTTDTTTNTEASTTTVEPVSTTDPATTIMSTSEATTPSTTESATPTDIITTTDALSTTDPITITEYTTTPEVTPTIESTTTAEATIPTTEAVTTTIEVTTTTTTEFTTTTEVTATEIVTTTTEPTTTIDPAVFCQGINSGAFPYPGNCYQYILCLNSLGIVSECAVNQIFNPAQGTCVPGDRGTCVLA